VGVAGDASSFNRPDAELDMRDVLLVTVIQQRQSRGVVVAVTIIGRLSCEIRCRMLKVPFRIYCGTYWDDHDDGFITVNSLISLSLPRSFLPDGDFAALYWTFDLISSHLTLEDPISCFQHELHFSRASYDGGINSCIPRQYCPDGRQLIAKETWHCVSICSCSLQALALSLTVYLTKSSFAPVDLATLTNPPPTPAISLRALRARRRDLATTLASG
jgi:hypothetical protein